MVKLERIGDGKYHVRLVDSNGKLGIKIPGMILGGQGRWLVQVGGQQWPKTFGTAIRAAHYLMRSHFGI